MYTLVEFIAANESEDFDNNVHSGDCTNESHPCLICSYERILSDYREYIAETELKYG